MIWLVLFIVLIVGFLAYRQIRRLMIEMNIAKARRDKLFKKTWTPIAFYEPSMPMRMAFGEVVTKSVYRRNFDTHFKLFIDYVLNADERLDPRIVQLYSKKLMEDLPSISGMSLDMNADVLTDRGFPNESGVFLAAVLYALIVTQDKGANIKKKLMLGENNHAGNDMYLQKKSDREYFEFMNKEHSNFCKLVNIMEPRKSNMIQIVAGYLLLDN